MSDFKQGDKVSWETSQGRTHGTVIKRLTSRTHVKGHAVDASEDEPQYLVKSDKTGEDAAHRQEALERN
jgi:uncharacterized protein YijF (DUF1287 family)